MTRALAMVSGGLDSILAAKLIQEQGIEVIGICFKSYFFGEENAERMSKQIDMRLEVVDFSEEHFEMVKNPKHGHGKNMNPCIDCHAMMMTHAGRLLEKFDADFIITGEVLGQRPMSQNKGALSTVLKTSGVGEKILRPLCAKNLPETEMEKSGLVDREKLMDIKGRSRKIQMALAEKWNIKDYPSPAGGCKLTEPGYSNRLKDLVDNKENISERELELLKYARHYRIDESCKIICTRTADEAQIVRKLISSDDLVFLVRDFNGPLTIIIGENPSEKSIEAAAKITGRYSKGRDEESLIVKYRKGEEENIITVKPADDEFINGCILK
ncbi:tRNA 4-thiouridine(8) synthase ThiI [Oceanirhabdus sp. W0125-5]|uniref:tRNA 4-thiouridine(8) synthase ThiI n=1 Tax=Oceanirhabdus sp. W0125-5 TaxID=2999116 RepID=UPI0022F2D28E|nr:tRNA 4-thiouridine(8) synthase ThiI [Oceanirhabdus sp. W0125-5]WBW98468.1 tRNA 4-thiouridine(8) synthase ThiI [Oceanirhabdus sp. W0125-5]